MEKSFSEIFKNLRKEKNLTQQELAEDFNNKYFYNYKKSAISMYENGKRVPEISALQDFADYFGVTVDYLLGKTENRKLTHKDEIDIAKQIEKINDSLENTEDLMFHGEILDDETRELLKKSLENTIYFSKILAKEKFNPNKNKDKKE